MGGLNDLSADGGKEGTISEISLFYTGVHAEMRKAMHLCAEKMSIWKVWLQTKMTHFLASL